MQWISFPGHGFPSISNTFFSAAHLHTTPYLDSIMAGRLMCMAHVAVIFPSAYYSVVQPYAVAVVQKAAESPLLKDSFPQINEIIVAQKLSCYVVSLIYYVYAPVGVSKGNGIA